MDKPYISCTGNGAGATHFQYKVFQGTTQYFTSSSYPVGTSVLHPNTFPVGEYTVKCYYGTSNTISSDAHTCVNTISVQDSPNVQGCKNIHAYDGNTLSTWDKITTSGAYLRCGSRAAVTVQDANAYRINVGSRDPLFLSYDIGSVLLNNLGLGSISVSSSLITFSSGQHTMVSCAVKVGTGYSTNDSCKKTVCIGNDTACAPQTFVVTPSSNLTCTTALTTEYNIGCNPDSSDYNTCVSTIISKM